MSLLQNSDNEGPKPATDDIHSLLLSAIVDSSDDAIISKDLTGRITSWNKGAERIFGYSVNEAVGNPITMLIPADRQDEEPQILARLQRGERVDHFETIRRRKDGTFLDVSLTISPIRDRHGRIIGASKIARDITERKRAEAARAQLSAIVESSGDAIYVYDCEQNILSWNRAAEEQYGYKEGEIVGRGVEAIVPPDCLAEHDEIVKQVLTAGGTFKNLEARRMRRDGSTFPALLTISPIRNATGNTTAISAIARDISEQKQNEESLRETQKLESLGVLAGGIAHDFNNLLTGVLGNASLLADEFAPGSPKAEILQCVTEAAERMARLTSQMLAYSGRGHFVIEPVDLSQEVRQITGLIQASIPKHVELRLSLASNLPLVDADVSQLQQVIMNLVINGAEAVRTGNGVVEVRTGTEDVGEEELQRNLTRKAPPAGTYVLLMVEDTGCGMDDAIQARIFDPFFTTKFLGRGLGLSSVLGIVRGHDGLITVESQPGRGSKFRVFFPISGSIARGKSASRGSGKGTILVVDDENLVRQLAKRALERVGYAVLTAVNGKDALDQYSNHRNDIKIVLLDMMMPVLSGEETFKHLLEIRPDAAVIAMSGFTEREARQRFGTGILDFIQKPFTAGQLTAKIGAALQSRIAT